jgi:hypothetical protein
VPSLPYLAVSRRPKTLVGEATAWRTGGPERCISFPQSRGVWALWVASGGITEGQAGAEDDLRRFGGDAVVEPGGRGYGPNRETGAAHPHDVRHAGAMSGAFRKAVAMLVMGPRGPVAIRVTRAARALSRCGPARQDRWDR